MTRVELKSVAKEQIKGKIGILFVMMLIIGALGVACSSVPVIGTVGALIITPVFEVSICMVYLKLTKNEEIKVEDIFNGFKITGKIVWTYIARYILVFVWSLLLVIPGIIKAFSYAMIPYIITENPELTTDEVLNKSKEIMDGHKFDLFVLQLSFFWWYMLVGITFGIASIYVIPYISATTANFYNSIKE